MGVWAKSEGARLPARLCLHRVPRIPSISREDQRRATSPGSPERQEQRARAGDKGGKGASWKSSGSKTKCKGQGSKSMGKKGTPYS